MPRITATSCRTANDRHRKTAIVPIRQEHKHFQTEKKIIFRALSFQRTRRLTADDSGTTSYPQPSAQFRPTGAHDILHDTQGSSPRFAPHVASSSDNAATISTDKIHSRTVFHYRPLPTKKREKPYGFLSLSSGGEDSNLRPLGYEPNELPTAPPRDISYCLDGFESLIRESADPISGGFPFLTVQR